MSKNYSKDEAVTSSSTSVSPQQNASNNTMQQVSTYESPTSVVTVPLDDSFLYSEHGTEVTLYQHNEKVSVDLSFHTPSKSRPVSRDINALLDMDITPSPAKSPLRIVLEEHTTPDSPRRTMPCCGANACWSPVRKVLHSNDDNNNNNDISIIESEIVNFLSLQEHETWMGEWQLWTSRCIDHQFREEITKPPPDSESLESDDLQDHIQRVLRNRAFDIAARQERLSALRRDLHPFHRSPSLHQAPAPKRTLSYQPKERSRHSTNRRPDENQLSFGERWKTWYCSPDVQDIESPSIVRRPPKDELCYDSDPEDFTRRRARRQGASSSNKENNSSDLDSSIDLDDDEVVQVAVEDFMNERWTLILHQDDSRSSKPSHAVHAWIERGLKLYRSVITPRFVWKPIHQESKNVVDRRSEMMHVDLLEIQRVLEVKQLDRERYPFAKLSNSFLIKSENGTVLLEAGSPAERDKLVRLLKLAVARLGSKLVTGDFALDEYFAFMEHGPGEEPKVISKKKKSKNCAP